MTLASSQLFPMAVAVDATSVYWVNLGSFSTNGDAVASTGALLKVPIGGGSIVTLAAAQNAPSTLLVSMNVVYWIDSGTLTSSGGAVLGVPVGGGSPITFVSGAANPIGLAPWSFGFLWTEGGSGNDDGVVLSYASN